MWFHIWIGAGTFQEKKSWGPFFGSAVGFPFYRSSPAKSWFVNSVDYLFVCSMFQYFTVSGSIYNITAHWHLPFHSYKVKTQPHTHRLEQIIHYRTENWVPVIRKHAPYRIETAISKAQNVVHVWAGTFQAKKSLGTIFRKVVWFPLYRSRPAQNWFVDSVGHLSVYSIFQYFTVSYSIYNIIAHWHLISLL